MFGGPCLVLQNLVELEPNFEPNTCSSPHRDCFFAPLEVSLWAPDRSFCLLVLLARVKILLKICMKRYHLKRFFVLIRQFQFIYSERTTSTSERRTTWFGFVRVQDALHQSSSTWGIPSKGWGLLNEEETTTAHHVVQLGSCNRSIRGIPQGWSFCWCFKDSQVRIL